MPQFFAILITLGTVLRDCAKTSQVTFNSKQTRLFTALQDLPIVRLLNHLCQTRSCFGWGQIPIKNFLQWQKTATGKALAQRGVSSKFLCTKKWGTGQGKWMHQQRAPTCTQYSHFLQIQCVNRFLSSHWQGSVSSPTHTDPFLPSGLSLSFEDDFEGEFRSKSSPTTSYNCLQVESGLRFQQIASFWFVMPPCSASLKPRRSSSWQLLICNHSSQTTHPHP